MKKAFTSTSIRSTLPRQHGEPSAVTHWRMQSLATQVLFDIPHMEDDMTDQPQEIWSIIRYRSRQEG
jgi:hypothetical protein